MELYPLLIALYNENNSSKIRKVYFKEYVIPHITSKYKKNLNHFKKQENTLYDYESANFLIIQLSTQIDDWQLNFAKLVLQQ